MPSRIQSVVSRQIIAVAVVGVLSLVVAVQFARLIGPAAAREVQAACTALRPNPDNPAFGPLPSQQEVDFTAQDHNGKPVKLSDFRGKWVFVNFWATWCNVCKSEKPSLERMVREMGSDDFVILTLASDASWEEVAKLYPQGAPFRVLLDPPAPDENLGPIAKSFGITAVPESFLVDPQGRIHYYFINKRNWGSDVAETCLSALVRE